MTSNRKTLSLDKKNIFTLTELEIGKVKSALLTRDISTLLPIYELMLARDSHIASEATRRRLAVQGSYFEMSAKDIDLWSTIDSLLDSILYGVSVFELFGDAGKMAWEPLPRSVLQYEKDGGIYLVTKQGERIDPAADKRTYVASSGIGALFPLIWIFAAKHFVLSHYMKFTEYLGVPPLIVNAQSSDAEEVNAIADMAEQLASGGVGVFGKDDTVNILEGRGSQSDFLEFIRYCDTQISLAIVGNTLSGNEGKGGSLAMSQTHQDSFKAITVADTRYVAKRVNALLSRASRPADFRYIIEEDKDLKTRAETLQIIQNMGYNIPKEYLAKEFDLPLESVAPAANRKEANAKAGDGDAIDNAALEADTRPIEREIAERIEAIFANTKSFDEAHAALIGAYPDIELPELEKTLERLIANSYIQGRIEI